MGSRIKKIKFKFIEKPACAGFFCAITISKMYIEQNEDDIIALATAPGVGAIAVLRASGPNCIEKTNDIFQGKDLTQAQGHTLHFGTLVDEGKVVDEVLVSVFQGPKSYTGENSVEISCHGSPFIVQEIIKLFSKHGVRYAQAGEFTKRAFMNGKLDLAQAEAVADLIASDSELSHKTAMNQMRGGFSKEIKTLRDKLVNFTSLIELELDFSEEDVEFADRSQLFALINELTFVIDQLIKSFDLGNVIKNGVPTVIAGKPNAGKSTLLNALLNEEKAIVSDIEGTTRDYIEDEINIDGIGFRFIDTAGLRETTDKVEAIGVKRTLEKMEEASLIIYLFDTATVNVTELKLEINKLENMGKPFLVVANKLDLTQEKLPVELEGLPFIVGISAKNKDTIQALKDRLLEEVRDKSFETGNTIVTNVRHLESLKETQKALADVNHAMQQDVPGDLLVLDIRMALHHLGEITGEITTEDILGNIFSKFCVGK